MTDRRTRLDYDVGIWPTVVPPITVHEGDQQPTGLLDRHGVPLMRPKPPVGFVDFSNIRRTH